MKHMVNSSIRSCSFPLRNEEMTAIMGSANLTRRNLDNYNLELDIKIITGSKSRTAGQILGYFDRMWNNENGYIRPTLRNIRKTLSQNYRLQGSGKSGGSDILMKGVRLPGGGTPQGNCDAPV